MAEVASLVRKRVLEKLLTGRVLERAGSGVPSQRRWWGGASGIVRQTDVNPYAAPRLYFLTVLRMSLSSSPETCVGTTLPSNDMNGPGFCLACTTR
jgi:hypothetical protein